MISRPLASLTRFTMRNFASISKSLAKSFQVLNYWRPINTGIGYSEEIAEWVASLPKPDRSSKNKKPIRPRDKTPADPDLNNVQQPKLAEQGPAGVDSYNKPGYEYGQNQHEVLLGDESQSKYLSGTSALSDDTVSQLEHSHVVKELP